MVPKVDFTPPLSCKYSLTFALRNDNLIYNKLFDILDSKCPADKPNKCPTLLIVFQRITAPRSPFKCWVIGVDTCVASRTKCDCTAGFDKCYYMNVCAHLILSIAKLPGVPFICDDGVCRKSAKETVFKEFVQLDLNYAPICPVEIVR
jgi:hypothetical protein